MVCSQWNDTFPVECEEPHHHISAQAAALAMIGQQHDTNSAESSRLAVIEYLEEIMQHIRQMENATLPDVSLIDTQPYIQWYIRPYVIDFLIEAHAELGLLPETLFLTMNLVDRYCSKRVVYKDQYQLLGCAALLIATKYAEKKDRIPSCIELHDFCCGLYAHGMFAQMEMHILKSLDWTIGHPTVDFFSQLKVLLGGDDQEVAVLAVYLCEIALYHREFVSIKPSVMAQSALAYARTVLGRISDDDRCWGQTESVNSINLWRYSCKPSPTVAHKYSSERLFNVSKRLAQFVAGQAITPHDLVDVDNCDGNSTEKVEENDVSSGPQSWKNKWQLHNFPTPPITPGSKHAMVEHHHF